MSCFVCLVCQKNLETGEHCYNLEGKFVCKEDYITSRNVLNLHPGHPLGNYLIFFFFSKIFIIEKISLKYLDLFY